MPKGKKAAQMDGEIDVFTRLGVTDPNPREPDDASGDDDGEDTGKLSALEARLAAQQKELDRLSRTNTALMATPPTFGVQPTGGQEQGEPEISMDGLPDPVTDAAAYHRELSKRIAVSIRQQTERELAEQRQQQEESAAQDRRTEALWAQFAEQHPELAENKDLVSVAAAQVAQRALDRGIDVNKYMFQASDTFFQDVVDETERRFGKALKAMKAEKGNEGGEGGDDDAEDNRPEHIKQASRALGIQGGVPGAGVGPGKGSEKPGSLVEDLHAVQRKLGLY